jgi:hypothetical protein
MPTLGRSSGMRERRTTPGQVDVGRPHASEAHHIGFAPADRARRAGSRGSARLRMDGRREDGR